MTHVPSPRASTRRTLRVSTAARAGLVAALVLGILGMHALSSHSTVTAASAAAVTAATPDAGHEAHAHAATGGSADAGSEPGAGRHHDMGTMVMLCAVMLAVAALAVLGLLLARGALRSLLPGTFWPAAVPERALPWVRGTGPPHEWQFSVIRC